MKKEIVTKKDRNFKYLGSYLESTRLSDGSNAPSLGSAHMEAEFRSARQPLMNP